MRTPLLAVLIPLLFVLACSSPPKKPDRNVRTPRVPAPASLDLRTVWSESYSRAYKALVDEFKATGSFSNPTASQTQACRGFPPLGDRRGPANGPEVQQASDCGWVAASQQLATEVKTGTTCRAVDGDCLLRRAYADDFRINRNRWRGRSPSCAVFLFRWREIVKSSPTWKASCESFRVFEEIQLRDNRPIWNAGDLRACLAPHLAEFSSLTSCLGEPASKDPKALFASKDQLTREQDSNVQEVAGDIWSLLASEKFYCAGAWKGTRLYRADGLESWASVRGTTRGNDIRSDIDAKHGPGALSTAVASAEKAVANFHSDMCMGFGD